jgi:hypothetical protein
VTALTEYKKVLAEGASKKYLEIFNAKFPSVKADELMSTVSYEAVDNKFHLWLDTKSGTISKIK